MCISIEFNILGILWREERLRRRRELYRLRRSTETPEQRESRLAARREQERRRLFSNYFTCIDNSSLTTIQHGRLREKAFSGTLILLVGQLQLLGLTPQCSNICLVISHVCRWYVRRVSKIRSHTYVCIITHLVLITIPMIENCDQISAL